MADEIRNIRDCVEIESHFAAFLDGEEPQSIAESITAHLSACSPCRKNVELESSARDLLQTRRGELRAAAPDALRARCAELHAAASRKSTAASFQSVVARRWMPLSVAATLLLAFGGVFGYTLNNPVEALATSLTLDHVKCFKMGDTDPQTDAAAEGATWEQQRGWPVVVPKTLAAEQLTLVDVRHCYSTDGSGAHLMYTWHGTPLSLYVLPEDAGHAGVRSSMGREAIIWCANRRTYAVIADEHRPQELTRIVEYMKANAR